VNTSRIRGKAPMRAVVLIAACGAVLHPATDAKGAAAFNFSPINASDIISATFTVDFAALTGARFFDVGGDLLELNYVRLIDVSPVNPLPIFDMSDNLVDIEIVQLDIETDLFTAPVDLSFFPAFETGQIGLDALFTDTGDAMFAIDFISLTIQTITETIEVFYGSLNDGFGIGIPDGGLLPSPLGQSIPFGATGTGFDEPISSMAIYKVPAPSSLALLAVGGTFALRRRRA
jgi:hypothetical protein